MLEGAEQHFAAEVEAMTRCIASNHAHLDGVGHLSFHDVEDTPDETYLVNVMRSTPNEVRLARANLFNKCAGRWYRSVIDDKDL